MHSGVARSPESHPVSRTPSRRRRLAASCLLAVVTVATAASPVGPAQAASRSGDLRSQIAELGRSVDQAGVELAAGATELEAAEGRHAALVQQRSSAESSAQIQSRRSQISRGHVAALVREAYQNVGLPRLPLLLTADLGAAADLAYVRRGADQVARTQQQALLVVDSQFAASRTAQASLEKLRIAALGDQQRLDLEVQSLATRAGVLGRELQATHDRLRQQVQNEQNAAQRAREAAALAAASRYAGTAGNVGGCLPPGPYGSANGFLADSELCPLRQAPGHRLRTDAARAFDALSAARRAQTGAPLCVTDSYRSYPAQVDVFARKPALAATPGRSQHGWGLAVDLCGGAEQFGTEADVWLRLNAGTFGWFHPSWADPGGSKPEAWHWEYAG